MAGMDDGSLRPLVDRRLLHPQREYHESTDRRGGHSRFGVLDGCQDLGLIHGEVRYYLKGDDINDLYRTD